MNPKDNPMRFPILFCLVASLGSGCSMAPPILSTSLSTSTAQNTAVEGLMYFLPKSFVHIEVKPDTGTKMMLTASIKQKPNPLRGFVAQTKFNSFANDIYKMETSAEGLLSVVSTDTTDVTPATVEQATSGIIDAIAGPQFLTRMVSLPPKEPVDVLLDPWEIASNPNQTQNIHGVDVTVKFDDPKLNALAKNRQRPAVLPCPMDASICVPILTTAQVKVHVGDAHSNFVMVLAHPSATMGIKLQRRACVQTKTSLALSDGILTNYDIDKPSEVAACLSIPLEILSAIISAPIEAITGRNARITAQTTLLTNQKALLDAQKAYLDAINDQDDE